MRDHERADNRLTYFMERACQPVAERDLFAPTRLRAGGLLEEAATLLVTYFDSVCERARRGSQCPWGVRTRIHCARRVEQVCG
jgi:hypothetical protein